jgi:prophage regulatory protein
MSDESILISTREACKLAAISRTWLGVERRAGRFPAPVSLGERRIAFVRAEVVAWIEARIAERGAKAAKEVA